MVLEGLYRTWYSSSTVQRQQCPEGKICCQFGLSWLYNHIVDFESGNGLFQNKKHPHGKRDYTSSSTDCMHGDNYCGYIWHCSIEKRGASGAFNNRTGYKKQCGPFRGIPFLCDERILWWTYPCLKSPAISYMVCVRPISSYRPCNWSCGMNSYWVHDKILSMLSIIWKANVILVSC